MEEPLTTLQDLDRFWNPSDVPASEAAFQALLPDAQGLGEDRCYLIEVLSWIARCEALQGKFPHAHTSLEAAGRLLEENDVHYRVSTKLRWLIENGRLCILEKTPAQARGPFAEAWRLAISSGEDYYAVEIAQLMAAAEPPKAQHEWLARAIEIAEKSRTERTKHWLGGLYTTLGWKFYDLRQFEKALQTFQTALALSKSRGTPREAFVAQISVGKVLRALGRTEEALAIHKALLASSTNDGRQDGRLCEELAECLQALNRTAEAQPYFELAYRELSNDEWITDNQPLKLKRMKDLGKVK